MSIYHLCSTPAFSREALKIQKQIVGWGLCCINRAFPDYDPCTGVVEEKDHICRKSTLKGGKETCFLSLSHIHIHIYTHISLSIYVYTYENDKGHMGVTCAVLANSCRFDITPTYMNTQL